MSHKFLRNASLHEALFALDIELARGCRHAGCWSCGHRLHVSNYPRKPHGVPVAFREHYGQRLSFTCAKCRWWRERFRATGFWKQAKGYFAEPDRLARLPADLLGTFPGGLGERLLATLRFLWPLTGGALRAV